MRKPTAKPGFAPFADGSAAQTIGGLTIENGRTGITLHGSLDLTRDRAGLARARTLKAALDAVVASLERADLPADAAQADEPTIRRPNPFA